MFTNIKAFSGFSVDNLKKAKEFYGTILGIEVTEQSEGLKLHIAGGNPIFVYEKANHVPATFTILNFPVNDISATVDELTNKGIKFEHYEGMNMNDKNIAHAGGPPIAWFKDPAGNFLSVLQEK